MKSIIIISILLIYGIWMQDVFIFWFAVGLIGVFYKEINTFLKKDIENYE